MKTIPAGLRALRPPSPHCMIRCLTPAGALGHGRCPQGAWDGDGKGGTSIAHTAAGPRVAQGLAHRPFPHLRAGSSRWHGKCRSAPCPTAPCNGPTSVIGADGPRFVYIWQSKAPRSPHSPAPAPSRHFGFLRFPFALSFAFLSRPVSPGSFWLTHSQRPRSQCGTAPRVGRCRRPIAAGASSSPGHSHCASLGAVWAAGRMGARPPGVLSPASKGREQSAGGAEPAGQDPSPSQCVPVCPSSLLWAQRCCSSSSCLHNSPPGQQEGCSHCSAHPAHPQEPVLASMTQCSHAYEHP